jgi:hypothetical protein
MSNTQVEFELETVPANEACAQVGQAENYSVLALAEARTYIAALQAKYGPAPQGCAFRVKSNAHDFGSYPSIVLAVERDDLRDPRIQEYLEQIEEGLEHWRDAGFTAPVEYDPRSSRAIRSRSADDAIFGALQATRSDAAGHFPYAGCDNLHTNLKAAYPLMGNRFDAWFAELTAEHADG